MADKKFGLPDSLINAVKQVAENNAPLPRDERERDLARQARSNPKSLDEALIGKQKKLDKNKNGKLDKQDFEMLRKEEAEESVEEGVYTPPGYDESPHKGYDPRSMSSFAKLKRKPLPTDVAPKPKTPSVKEEIEQIIDEQGSPEFERLHNARMELKKDPENEMLKQAHAKAKKAFSDKISQKMKEEVELDEGMAGHTATSERTEGGHRAIVKDSKGQTRYAGSSVYPSAEHAVKGAKAYINAGGGEYGSDMERSHHKHVTMMAKEETELDEALTPAQRKALQKRREAMRGTKAAPKPKKAYVHSEPDDESKEPKRGHGDESETPSGEKETHIVMAARKAVNLGEYPFTFENGKTHIIDKSTGRKIIKIHGEQKDKNEFESRLRSSHEGMMIALKNPENAPPKPKGKFALGPLRPDFMSKLNTMAAAHNARQKAKGK